MVIIPEQKQDQHSDDKENQGGSIANRVDQFHRGKVGLFRLQAKEEGQPY